MKHQIVTSKFPTLERQALNRVREQFPRLKRRGFATALRAAFPHEIHRKEVSFIPDRWFIEGDLLAGENGGPCATRVRSAALRNPACPPAALRRSFPSTTGCFRRKPLPPSRRARAHKSWLRSTAS